MLETASVADIGHRKFYCRHVRWFIQNACWTPQSPSACLHCVTHKHCRSCSCWLCVGSSTGCLNEHGCAQRASSPTPRNATCIVSSSKKKNIKQSSSEFLGSRVKIPFFCTVCGVCYTTEAYGASDLVVILHKWTFVEPREVTRRYSLASGVTSCVQWRP